MAIGKVWAGRAYGTNIGNLFVKLEGEDAALRGTLRHNEPGVALVSYKISGSFDGTRLAISGEPETKTEGVVFGKLKAAATLGPTGNLEGEWETDIGSAGTFILYPHDRPPVTDEVDRAPDQLHTARHHFGAVEIDNEQIIAVAEDLQKEFSKGKVVITVITETEQSRFLGDFKKISFNSARAELIKVFVQEPDGGGLNRVASIEFGPHANLAMTQGISESWVLGRLERFKRDLRRFERTYTTNVKRLGFGINQLLLIGAIVFLPSLGNLRDRTIFMVGVLAIIAAVNWLHNRYLPFAAIYLSKKPQGLLSRVAPSVVSWIIAVTASVAATLLAVYLQGWLSLPTSL